MAREKWLLILKKAAQQNRVFTKAEVDDWLAPYYYGGKSSRYASQMLQRMIKDGCIKRIKIGHYQVMRSPKPYGNNSATAKQPVSNDPSQTSLF